MADSIAEFARKALEALKGEKAQKKEVHTPEYTAPRTLEISHSKPPAEYNFVPIDPGRGPEERIVGSKTPGYAGETAPYKQSNSKTPDKHSVEKGWAAVDEVPRAVRVGPVGPEQLRGDGTVEKPAAPSGMQPTDSDIRSPSEVTDRIGRDIASKIRPYIPEPSDAMKAYVKRLGEKADESALLQRQTELGKAYNKYPNPKNTPGEGFTPEEKAMMQSELGIDKPYPRDITSFTRSDASDAPVREYTEEEIAKRRGK